MDIQLIMCDEDGENRSLNFYKKQCLELFISDETMAVEIEFSRSSTAQEKLRLIALEELESENILVSHETNSSKTFFLRKEIWDHKETFELSLPALVSAGQLYNSIMPSLMKDPSLFIPIAPLDFDNAALEGLISILNLTLVAESGPVDFDENGEENTFTVE